jgi:hypothetical protein
MQMNIAKMVTIAAAILVVGMAHARTEPNSFLNRPATTHAALLKQVQTDDVVMGRFMRHFGMTREEVVSYFSTLRLDTLKEDGVYLVYNVPESEEIRARAIFYKAGTKVWVDAEDRIVLKESCGNPMVRGSDSREVALNAPVSAEVSPVKTSDMVPVGTPTDAVATALPVDVESSALNFPAATPGSIASLASTSGFNAAYLLPAVAAIPFVVSTESNDPVPEPATMTLLGLAAAGFAAKRRKNK